MRRDIILWAAILTGPIVWLISFEANFALVPWACIFQIKLVLHTVSIVALALVAGLGLLAWREWEELGREWPNSAGGVLPRGRIMAVWGLLMSAFFFLVILAQSIPQIMLGVCQ